MKRNLILLFVLVVSLLFTSTVQAQPLPPTTPSPADNAEYIIFPLELDWEDVEGAQSYYYEIIDVTEPVLVRESSTSTIPIELLIPQHLYQWHVKSCTDSDGKDCGGFWEHPWSFTYSLPPPELYAEDFQSIPVELDWEDVEGAQSYELLALPCPAWLEIPGEDTTDCFSIPILSDKEGVLHSEYIDDVCFFTQSSGISYYWGVASCLDENAAFCGPSTTPLDLFKTISREDLEQPTLRAPLFDSAKSKIPIISKQTIFEWSGPSCAYLYKINVVREKGNELVLSFITEEIQIENAFLDEKKYTTENTQKLIEEFWGDLDNFNTTLKWSVTPCWTNPFGKNARCESSQSEEWKFQIVVEPPKILEPSSAKFVSASTPSNTFVKIPFPLHWEEQEAAKSYNYQIAKDRQFTEIVKKDVVNQNRITIEYEESDIVPGKNYWWRVNTCVDTKGELCGEWSMAEPFSTYPLLAPTNPTPVDKGEMLLTANISWQKDNAANSYQYNLEYWCRDIEETLDECLEYKISTCEVSTTLRYGIPLVTEKITSSNRFPLPINCLGEYRFVVRSCIDEECKTLTTPEKLIDASLWSFTALEPPSTPIIGIVPCGRDSNNRDTPYNERESCQFKHVGFMIQNILDFVLWKLSLLILSVLLMLRIVSIFFSFGDPAIAANIKGALRSFLIGFVILLTAWIIINLIMGFLGFQIEFFGRWWELPF